MLDVVTSANVACGFHAGDPVTMRAHVRTGRRARCRRRRAGRLPRPGRLRAPRSWTCPPDELTADVIYQIGALEALARVAGTRVAYVKPHGALYNAVVHHEAQAAAVVDAVAAVDRRCRSSGCRARSCSRLAAAAAAARRRRGLRRPRLHPRRHAGPAPRPRRRAARRRRGRRPAWSARARRGRDGGRRHRCVEIAAPTRSASTATRPARSPWRRPCGQPSRPPVSRSVPSRR